MRLEKELQVYQLELQKLKLTASADRLRELSPSAELTLQTQLAEAESSLAVKQSEMGNVTFQLQDHREVLAGLQQVKVHAAHPPCLQSPTNCTQVGLCLAQWKTHPNLHPCLTLLIPCVSFTSFDHVCDELL